MNKLTEEKEKSLTIDQTYSGFLYNEKLETNINTTLELKLSNSTYSSVTFLDKRIGALICNDIGNRNYDNIFKQVVDEYTKTYGTYNPESTIFQDMLATRLKAITKDIDGYKLIDFVSGIVDDGTFEATGFQGGIYYNETTGDYVVVCRGTEFKSGNEEFYKDFVQTDVLEFGKDIVPSAFYATEELLIRAIDMANKDHSKVHIVGHSLGGGIAQLLGSLEDYKDIDVTTYNPVGVEHLLNEEAIKNRVQTGTDKFSNIINYATCNDFVSTIFKCVGKMEMIKCVGLPEMILYMGMMEMIQYIAYRAMMS